MGTLAAMDEGRIGAALELERERLERLQRALEGDDGVESQRDSVNELTLSDQHPADVGSETFERTKDFAVLENVLAELADVEHALRRLKGGTYGTCEACGQDIALDRLEALPAARFCVRDQVKAEREARTGTRG